MQPEDRPKADFASHNGLYEFTVMPFGLSNSPATFKRLMEINGDCTLWTPIGKMPRLFRRCNRFRKNISRNSNKFKISF